MEQDNNQAALQEVTTPVEPTGKKSYKGTFHMNRAERRRVNGFIRKHFRAMRDSATGYSDEAMTTAINDAGLTRRPINKDAVCRSRKRLGFIGKAYGWRADRFAPSRRVGAAKVKVVKTAKRAGGRPVEWKSVENAMGFFMNTLERYFKGR